MRLFSNLSHAVMCSSNARLPVTTLCMICLFGTPLGKIPCAFNARDDSARCSKIAIYFLALRNGGCKNNRAFCYDIVFLDDKAHRVSHAVSRFLRLY